jgi:hypothetical protein
MPDSNNNLMKHQIRMEIALEAGTERINVAGILRELMKRANATTAVKVMFADAKGTPTSYQTLPKGQEFATRMSVEKVETGRNNKVVLGLYMMSESNMQTIKTTIGFPWLRQHQIYMRHQRMSFDHGTDLFLIGYLVQEHPNFANLEVLESEIQRKWFDEDAIELLSANEDGSPDDNDPNAAEFAKRIASMAAEGLIQAGKLTIPISVERSFVKVVAPGKPNFDTQILSVYVPRKHHVAATFLNDHLILTNGDLSIVPFSISKSDPRHFYQQMKNHAKFLHEHRNIPILSVPTREYYSEKIEIDSALRSLQYLLASNPNIHRFHYLRVQQKINVSVKAVNYAGVCKWLDNHLGKFTYGPHRNIARTANSHSNPTSNSRASNANSKYAEAFSSSSTETSSFDPSTIATGRTRGAWNRGPPTELIFEPADEIEFPSLPTPTRGAPTGATRTTHIDTNPNPYSTGYGTRVQQPSSIANTATPRRTGESTVEALIARAVAASEAQMTRQFADIVDRQNKLDKEIALLHAELTSQASKIVEGTIQALSGPSSPFLTKADALELKQQHNDTQTHIRSIQHTLSRLMSHFTTEASRPPAAPDESDTVVSPPRKISRTPTQQQHHHTPADPTTPPESMDWGGDE